MFTVHSTESVLAEVIYHLQRDNPMIDGGAITNLRKKFEDNLDEMVAQYDATIAYDGADPYDRHVHAAAVASQADILLTADHGFASTAASDSLPYSVYGCDAFFQLINNSSSMDVREVARDQMRYWAVKRKSEGERVRGVVESLVLAGCPEFANDVDKHLRALVSPTSTSR